jgi:hypothetical protein
MSTGDTVQDVGKFRKNEKDQYYTKPMVAEQCIAKLIENCPNPDMYQWIEPSAGSGVFLRAVPQTFRSMGIDIDPKSPDILRGDFLTWCPATECKRIFFGNPPFGRQGSLAKSFIKHSAQFADIIAFILPRSFVKPSMNRVFPLKFHCVYSGELEKNSFVVNGLEYDVPCVFQIWAKKETDRLVQTPIVEEGFRYVKYNEPFDIAFKRAGGKAGQCNRIPMNDAGHQYHYYLKLDEKYVSHVQTIIDSVNAHVFPSNTAGPRSLSKSEANEFLNTAIANTDS